MNTITKERLQRLIRAIDSESYDEEEIVGWVNSDEIMELARIALASHEAEPVPGLFIKCTNIEPRPGEVTIAQATPMEDGKYHESCFQLYAAPPALVANIHPLLEFAREYIESWDLGMAGDSSLLASAKKAIADSSAHQPAPVSVPDDVMAAVQKVARIRLDLNDFDGDKRGILDCLGDAEEALIEVVNRRAAMLQGAENAESPTGINQGKSEPVTTAYKLPFEQWLSQQTGTIDVECGCVMTEVFFHWLRVAYEAGSSPVIPGGSEDTKRLDWLDAQNKRLNEYYGTSYGWKFDANFQRNAMMLNDSNYPVMTVRQAIDEAIAAAPQQEVK